MANLAAHSGGLDIWVLSIFFQKSNIGGPQQPLTERLRNISKNLDFLWSNPQKGTSNGNSGARGNEFIKIRKAQVFPFLVFCKLLKVDKNWWIMKSYFSSFLWIFLDTIMIQAPTIPHSKGLWLEKFAIWNEILPKTSLSLLYFTL